MKPPISDDLNGLNDWNVLNVGEKEMPGVLDADTHIAESEAMWSFIDKEMYPRRPVLARIPDDTLYKERNAFLAHRRRDISQTSG